MKNNKRYVCIDTCVTKTMLNDVFKFCTSILGAILIFLTLLLSAVGFVIGPIILISGDTTLESISVYDYIAVIAFILDCCVVGLGIYWAIQSWYNDWYNDAKKRCSTKHSKRR